MPITLNVRKACQLLYTREDPALAALVLYCNQATFLSRPAGPPDLEWFREELVTQWKEGPLGARAFLQEDDLDKHAEAVARSGELYLASGEPLPSFWESVRLDVIEVRS